MQDFPPASVISYATPRVRRPPGPWLRRIAVGCGVLPLMVGLLDLMAWVVSAHSITIGIGLFTIVVGFWMVVIGFICAVAYAVFQRNAALPPRRWLKTFLLICLLYATTFGAALGSIWITEVVPPRNQISVTNTSNVPLSSFSLDIGSNVVDLGKLSPGQSIKYTWRSEVQTVLFSATFEGNPAIKNELIVYHGGGPEGVYVDLDVQPNQYKVDGRLTMLTTLPAAISQGR